MRGLRVRCAVAPPTRGAGSRPYQVAASRRPDTETNGLALCVLHQRLFDRGAFTLSKQLQIMVSDEAYGSAGFQEWLMRYHGEMLSFPQRQTYYPNERYISWHVREVFQGEYRE